MNPVDCVDVVVDVPAARLAEAFTYLVGGSEARLGARVRVPFGGRTVDGWIVSDRRAALDPDSLKPIESEDDEQRALDASLVRLAGWLHKRYACSYREAIAAVAGKGASRKGGALYRLVDDAAQEDESRPLDMIRKRFGTKPFAGLAALRTLREGGEKISLGVLLRELDRF
ncbi:MAG TPA: hypothetical protein VFF43_22555, partial [Caldimonas sp.]|nr:hypothetical protein [Caldimonas sp.]